MNKKPRITRTETVARSRLFAIEQVGLAFANGEQREYERINAHGAGAVMIIPVTDDNRVIMVREYAVGTDRYELMLPKGVIHADESIEDAANREIMEEIGFGAQRLQTLNSMTLAPGYLNFTTHLVLARGLYEQSLPGDEPEPLDTLPWKLNDLSRLLQHPELTEARSIAALYLVRDYLEP
jgi:ADP-ribose diphosphatase